MMKKSCFSILIICILIFSGCSAIALKESNMSYNVTSNLEDEIQTNNYDKNWTYLGLEGFIVTSLNLEFSPLYISISRGI